MWPFTTLSTLIDDFERTMASTKRIFNMMNTDTKIKNPKILTHLDNLKADISFDNVGFSYDNQKPLFENFNLSISFGSSIGIVGDTGSGKTTIAKLLLRLYNIDKGKITIGDTPIDMIDIGFLRKRIGIVNQSPFLFNSTIRDNIGYGLSNPTMEQIKIAAQQSQAMEFIEKLPRGFDTIVGERGQMLSGGQQQRIAIARTVIRNPDIVIFDEATSSVDNKTEQLIQKALFNIQKGRTSIIIAHRLSTIRNCNSIFLIKNGKIAEQGNHESLLGNKDSYYSLLWNIQTGKRTKI